MLLKRFNTMCHRYNKISESLYQKLKNIVGYQFYFSKYEIRWTYAFEGSIFEKDWIPELILMPQTVKQVSEVLKLANKNQIPVTPRGSGTSLSAGSLAAYGGIIIDFNQMNKINVIDIENNLVEVEPGLICDELNEILKPYGYFFPPDPGSSSVCTIGGMVATNAGGIQAFKYGVTKDYILYLEVVLANGSIITLGSKALKSVSTYNLKDLVIGSEGNLGIITKIGLRIIPLPKNRVLGLYIFENVDAISESVIKIRQEGIVPNLLEFLDKLTAKVIFEYLGGQFSNYPKGYVLLAELDGNNNRDVQENFSKINDVISNYNPLLIKIASTDKERERLISARKSALPALARISPSCCLEDCTIQITQFSKIIKKIEKIPKDLNIDSLQVATFGHMDGNLHPTFLFNENNDSEKKEFEQALKYLYQEIIIPFNGTITGEHGIGKIKTIFLEQEHGSKIIDIMYKIKKCLDPNNILNPGQGKGDIRRIKSTNALRKLINLDNKILELNCMRCGFCTTTCPSKLYYKNEAYSPRGRLSILNGLVYGDLILSELINDIFHTCSLCGLCKVKCPAGVNTYEIFEKTRAIIHKTKIKG